MIITIKMMMSMMMVDDDGYDDDAYDDIVWHSDFMKVITTLMLAKL